MTSKYSKSNQSSETNSTIIKEIEINKNYEFDQEIKVEQGLLGLQPVYIRDTTIVKPDNKEPSIFKLLHDKLMHRGDNKKDNKINLKR